MAVFVLTSRRTCAGGNLYDAIASEVPGMGWYQRGRRIALDVAKGLVHLHSRSIIHLVCLLCCEVSGARAAQLP